ncbi:hypothetical protein [Streptomyces sp. V3I7]|uniref:hypothetical protein n=1 Tax=Streptomyces sp. V3I7 TaxID=3042278 RepID=UPI0027D8273C|nr:hypothetical protein [Streptomyces sp. V3I7]
MTFQLHPRGFIGCFIEGVTQIFERLGVCAVEDRGIRFRFPQLPPDCMECADVLTDVASDHSIQVLYRVVWLVVTILQQEFAADFHMLESPEHGEVGRHHLAPLYPFI